jgi:hypothetical protein
MTPKLTSRSPADRDRYERTVPGDRDPHEVTLFGLLAATMPSVLHQLDSKNAGAAIERPRLKRNNV